MQLEKFLKLILILNKSTKNYIRLANFSTFRNMNDLFGYLCGDLIAPYDSIIQIIALQQTETFTQR